RTRPTPLGKTMKTTRSFATPSMPVRQNEFKGAQNNMVLFVTVLLAACALTGLLQLVKAYSRTSATNGEVSVRLRRKAVQSKRGFWSLIICSFSLVLMRSGYSGPIETLITTALLLALGYALALVDFHELFGR